MGKIITTSRGVQLECLPIAPLLEKLQAQHPMPEPPTYEVKTSGGVVEKHIHDETTLDTDAEKAAWGDYQARLAAAQGEFNLALMRLIMLRGVKVELPADDGWIEEQKFIGLAVPEEPLQRKLHYLETEVLSNEADYAALVAGVMSASGVPEEVVAEAEATFRGAVGRHAADGPEPADDGQALENEQPVRAGPRGGAKRHGARERV